MGKNKRKQIEVLDTRTNKIILVDSQEEVDTFKFLLRGLEIGVITDFKYQPCSFTLSDGVKYKDSKGKQKTLFQPHIYSPDFLITVNPKCEILKNEFKILNEQNQIYIDVKGVFARNGSDRSFSINQKWMMQKFEIYVYKLVPKKFFMKTGIPKELQFTNKTKKISTKYSGYPMMDQILKI